MPESGNNNTQLICTSRPFCLCVGEINQWDECDCFGVIARGLFRYCAVCSAQLVEIDLETGAEIAA